MIEVLMGAVILAIATFAIMNGLDGAQATGAMNKQRSVSSTLAQQDIERLRAFPITALSNYHQTRTVDVAGVGYTVDSRSEWIRDSSGVVSCTNDAASPQYMKLTSTVHSPASVNRSVREVSLLTPAPGAFSGTAGTVAVKVTNRNAQPHVGVTVQLSGPGSYSDTTNEFGCAIFGMIPAGNYDVNIPGYVGWGGEGFADGQVAVVAAKTSLKQLEVEAPASLSAKFKVPTGVPADWATAAVSSSATVANAKLPGGFKEFTVASPASAIDATGLFPFLDGYGVYAGTCRANNPAFWQSTYFQPGGPGHAALNPGDFLKPVDVHMGALRVYARTSGGTNFASPLAAARVTVRLGDTGDTRAGCAANTLVFNVTTTDFVDFILPMGTYRVCVSGASTAGGTVRNRLTATTASTGVPAHPRMAPTTALYQTVTMGLPSSGSSGACSTSAT
jgi:Tfp pilus assembly protein PilV